MIKSMNSVFQSQSRWWIIFVSAIFKLVLDYSYINDISPLFNYAGLILNIDKTKYIESWILYMVLIYFLPRSVDKPSSYFIGLSLYSFITPLLSFYGLASQERWMLYFVLSQAAIIMLVVSVKKHFEIKLVKGGDKLVLISSVLGVLLGTFWMLHAVGLSSFNLNLLDVYNFRENANEKIYAGFMGYLIGWVINVFGAVVLTMALFFKRRGLVFVMIIVYIFWFSLTSHKGVLFYPALLISVFLVLRATRSIVVLPVIYLSIVLSSVLMASLYDSAFLSSLIVRRVFFVPAHLTFVYFEYFNANQYLYWSNSIFSSFISYPYSESIALVIGSYLNDKTLWANNSFYSTGYMQAGVVGVVIYGLLVGLMLKFIDSIARRGVPVWVCLTFTIIPLNTLIRSSDLPSAILTNGIGLSIFLLYLYAFSIRNLALKAGLASSHWK